MRIAVFGATGVVGRALVPRLAERNEVVAVSRHAQPARRVNVETATADVTDAPAVRRVLVGIDVVYYLVHSLGSSDYAERDRSGAANVAREAERAGVTQIVYLGGLGDDTPALSPHLRSRIETATALASGAVPVTTLRAAVVVGRGSAGFETIVALVNRLPLMIAPRWVSTETQPIALADIARYLDGVAGHKGAIGRSFDVGRPEVLTCRDDRNRCPARGQKAADRRGAGSHAAPVVLLAAPRDSGARRRRHAARGRPPQPDGRA